MIKAWEMDSIAFKALSPIEHRIYTEMRRLYNGRNNGQIAMPTRRAGEVCHMSNSTGARALERLRALGFIKLRQDSSFGQKRLAREYELTAISLKPAEKGSHLPRGTRDFMKLDEKAIAEIDFQLSILANKKQNIVPFKKRPVPSVNNKPENPAQRPEKQ